MATFDTPAVNVDTKSNEQNLQILKSYLSDMADELNYKIALIESRLDALEAAVQEE